MTRWLFGDQLGPWFLPDGGEPVIVIESLAALRRQRWHRQELHLLLSAMRHRTAEPGDRAISVRATGYRAGLAETGIAPGFSSIVSAWKGDDATAVDQAERAIRLSPFDPLLYLPYIGLAYAHFAAGRFEESAAAAGRASQSNPKFSMPYVLQAGALASLGRSEEARAVADALREVEPDLTVSTAIRSARFANPDKNAELGDALLLAGLPA